MDKGGKGFSLPSKVLKSSLKPTPSTGSLGKGGKRDKNASGFKMPETKEPQPGGLKLEQGMYLHCLHKCHCFKTSKCLMDCEAAQILKGIQEQMVLLSRDPTINLSVSFDKGLQYAKTGAHYTNPQSVRRALETLKKHGVSESEICMIANVCPETADEVFAFLPSLKYKTSTLKEPLQDVLSELAKLKKLA